MGPSLRLERSLLRGGADRVAGMDEVGRGAVAGMVSVGVAVATGATRTAPKGLTDSKELTAAQRRALVPRLVRWAAAHAVGHSAPSEIDEFGLSVALRLAGRRALAQVGPVDHLILDGNWNWLADPADLGRPTPSAAWPTVTVPPVTLVIRGDQRCSTVAAASVLGKTERDSRMADLAVDYPGYGWERNKGYSTRDHNRAMAGTGLTDQHRRSWDLAVVRGRGPQMSGQ